MKSLKSLGCGAIICLFALICLRAVHSNAAEPYPTGDSPADSNSFGDTNSWQPWVEVSTTPTNGIYWSLEGNFPPTPFDPVPAFTLYTGQTSSNYVYDDRGFSWSNYHANLYATTNESAGGSLTKDDAPAPPGGGGGSGGTNGSGSSNTYSPPVYVITSNFLDFTNFWLEITNTAGDAFVSIGSTLPGLSYEILTNATLNPATWGVWQTILASNSITPAPPIGVGSNEFFFNAKLLGYLGPNAWYPGPANGAPFIVTQPVGQIVSVLNPATFSIDAIGAPLLKCQWFFDGNPVSGATASTFTIPYVEETNVGWYVAVVSNAVGTATSDVATLATSISPPVIITQPTNQSVYDGDSATFAVTAIGAPTLNYQWIFGGTNISGATNSAFIIADVQSTNAGNYFVAVTNVFGSVTSTVATLTRSNRAPIFVYTPISQTVVEGDTVTFAARAIGTEPISYQWQAFDTSTGFTNLPGQNASRLVFTNMQSTDGGSYALVVSNVLGTNSFTNAVLDDITSDSSGQVANYGIMPVFGPRQDYTFQHGSTYYIFSGFTGTNVTDLYGTTTIQGGSVLKFDYDEWSLVASLVLHGPLVCETANYRPAILTSVDDDSQGAAAAVFWYDNSAVPIPTIDASSGTPRTAVNGLPYLNLDAVPGLNPTAVTNIRFCYADQAVTTPTNSGVIEVWNCQFVNCNSALNSRLTNGPSTNRLHNVLFSSCNTVIAARTNLAELEGEQVTADVWSFWSPEAPPGKICLTNSIVEGDFGQGVPANNQNVVINPDEIPFADTSNAFYYLASDSTCRAGGTTSISPAMLQLLKGKTTDAPIAISGNLSTNLLDWLTWGAIGVDEMTLFPVAKRYNGGAPDLGFYYDPLDYTVAAMFVTNQLTILPGTAVGIRNDFFGGIFLQDGASLSAQGSPTNPIVFADPQLVQEGPISPGLTFDLNQPWWWQFVSGFDTTAYLYGGVTFICPQASTNTNSSAPTINMRFCNVYATADDSLLWAGDLSEDFGFGYSAASSVKWTMQDCSVQGGQIILGTPTDSTQPNFIYPPGSLTWKNNVFDTVMVDLDPSYRTNDGWSGNGGTNNLDFPILARNNTFKGGGWSSLWALPQPMFIMPISTSAGPWTFQNNLFDASVLIQQTDNPILASHNGYWPARYYSDFEAFLEDAQIYGAYPSWAVVSELTNSSGGDQILTTPPPYQPGAFGNYYMTPGTALAHSGSATANLLGLYEYTTATNQTLNGNATVDIGLNYVAASYGGNGWTPLSTNGIANYIADAGGNGTISSNAANPSSSFYTNIDLDGDDMVGLVESALSANPLVFDNPMSLQQVVTGAEPYTNSLRVSVSYSVVTNVGQLTLLVDGVPAANQQLEADGGGHALLVWDATTNDPGRAHYLQAHLILNGSTVSADGPLLALPEPLPPDVGIQPPAQTNGLGGTVTFTGTNSSSGNYTYQWQLNGTNILGATNSSLTITNLALTNGGDYTFLVTNQLGQLAGSSGATLVVSNIYVGILTQPMSQTIFEPDTVTFAVTAAGTNLTYQWQELDANPYSGTSGTFTNIPSATSSNFSLYGVNAVYEGGSSGALGTYAVLVAIGTNTGGTNAILSQPATLTDNGPVLLGGTLLNAYLPLIGPRQNYTFRGDTTYLIGAPWFGGAAVDLYGPTIIKAGAVIKFSFQTETNFQYPLANKNSGLVVHGDFSCDTEPYRPATLTSMNDDSQGEWIYYSDYYLDQANAPLGTTYLNLDDAHSASPIAITNLRFFYADQAVTVPTNSRNLQIWDSQFVFCNSPLYSGLSNGCSTNGLHNVLFAACNFAIAAQNDCAEVDAEQISADVFSFCDPEFPPSRLNITNSIVYGKIGDGPVVASQNTANPSAWPFQSANDGNYYLPTGSPYRSNGTVNISPAMLADLTNRTTTAPISVVTNLAVLGQMTLYPQANRYAGGSPDLGYAYPPLDYTIADVHLQGGTITVLPGTAIGFRNDYLVGIYLFDNSSLTAQGTPTKPIVFTDNTLVQEGPFAPGQVYNQYVDTWWASGLANYGGPAFFVPVPYVNDNSNAAPVINMRFCNFFMTHDDYGLAAGQTRPNGITYFPYAPPYAFSFASSVTWNMQDCNVEGGQMILGDQDGSTNNPPGFVSWINNLFDETFALFQPSSNAGTNTPDVDLPFYACNNLFKDGTLVLDPIVSSQGNWQLANNLFDREQFWQNSSQPLDYNCNAYWTNASLYNLLVGPVTNGLTPTTTDDGTMNALGDKVLASPPLYVAGRFGRFYQSTNSLLINQGNTNATALGLAAFTVLTNGAEEGTNRVSIGLHYAAVDSSGTPDISSTNGLQDWWQYAYFGGIGINPANLSTNGDGYTDEGAYQLGLDPTIIYPNPIILEAPVSQEAYVGTSVQFAVLAEGQSPVTYQWAFNGNPIQSATNTVLTLSSIQLTNSGQYSVIVTSGSNASASVVSAALSVLVNVPPIARPDVFGVAENSTATQLNVLQNDNDPNDDFLNISEVTTPQNGTISYTPDGTTFQYTPNSGFFGVDSFIYTITNQHGGSASAPVNVFVTEIGDAFPSLNDLAFTLQTNVYTVTFNSFTNSSAATNILFACLPPQYGTISTNSAGDITYVRDTNRFGNDSFSYILTDGVGGYAVGNVAISQVDTVGAGLPDQWQLAYGMDPTVDNSEDDPDGDGLPNLAEFVLGTDPLVGDNPLNLPTVTNGMFVSGILQLPLTGIDPLLPNPPVILLVNGVPAADSTLRQAADGTWLFNWDTSFTSNGTYSIQAEVQYGINNEVTNGVIRTVQVANAITFDRLTSRFTDYGLIINATLAATNANYLVQLYDDSGNALVSWAGSTTNGQINNYWDLTDGHGTTISTGNVQAAISFSSDGPVPQSASAPGSGSSGSPAGQGGFSAQGSDSPRGGPNGGASGSTFHWWYRDGSPASYNFTVAWGWSSDFFQFINNEDQMIENGVVNILANPSDVNSYSLGPCCIWNMPYTSGTTFTYKTEFDKRILTNALSQGYLFFWLGHGGANVLLGNPDLSNISAQDVRKALGNFEFDSTPKHPKTNSHPYKLVILNGCETDSVLWTRSFGIDYSPPGTTNFVAQYMAAGRSPRAFVGWVKQNDAPNVVDYFGITHVQFGDALAELFSHWMAGDPLGICMETFSDTALGYGFEGQDSWNISGCWDLQRGE